MKIYNFYFFFISKLFLNDKNNFKKFIIKTFYLKKNYKIFNQFLNIINSVFILNLKDLKENEIITKNKENILFFIYNSKIYDINFIDIILNNNFLNNNLKIYYYNFYFLNFYNIKKFIFILKLKFFLKKCQH